MSSGAWGLSWTLVFSLVIQLNMTSNIPYNAIYVYIAYRQINVNLLFRLAFLLNLVTQKLNWWWKMHCNRRIRTPSLRWRWQRHWKAPIGRPCGVPGRDDHPSIPPSPRWVIENLGNCNSATIDTDYCRLIPVLYCIYDYNIVYIYYLYIIPQLRSPLGNHFNLCQKASAEVRLPCGLFQPHIDRNWLEWGSWDKPQKLWGVGWWFWYSGTQNTQMSRVVGKMSGSFVVPCSVLKLMRFS